MPDYFFDTSGIAKHYVAEAGTARVDALLAGGAAVYISRLTPVEFHSALAKKVRTGHLGAPDFETISRRFRANVAARRFRTVRFLVDHFQTAERLIRRVGPAQNLRTLDALQLAVALRLNAPGRPVTFVGADQALCGIAAAEGLT